MSLRPGDPPDRIPGPRDRTRRPGSRLLLGIALAGCVIGALYAGVRITDFLCDIAGIESTGVRLGGKVAVIAILLPGGFYLVERFFLSRSSRGRRDP